MNLIDRSLNYGRHHIEHFLRAASPYQRVLDIGAGGGDDLALARRAQPAAELHAIEVFPPSVQRLTQHGIHVHPIDLERERFPLDDGAVDVVIANQVLEHTKEIFWIFHEVTRVLRVGGSFVIGVPNLAALHNRLLLLTGRQPSPLKNDSAHVRGYTRRDLLRFVDRIFPGGYRLANFGGSNFYPFPPALARPLAALLPGMAWGIFLRLEKVREYRREFVEYPARERLETNFYLGEAPPRHPRESGDPGSPARC